MFSSGPGPVNVAGKMVTLGDFFTENPVGGMKVFCSDDANRPGGRDVPNVPRVFCSGEGSPVPFEYEGADDAAFANQPSSGGASLTMFCAS